MKKVFLKLSFILLIAALMLTIVGCKKQGKPNDNTGNENTHTHLHTEEITKVPSCTEEGEKTFTCSCGDSYTEAIEKLPHTEEILPSVAPTCTEDGLTEGKKCSVCGIEIAAQTKVPATGHHYSDYYDTTCNNEGCDYVRDADCPHSNTTVLPGEAATCTSVGLTEGKVCNDCGKTVIKQESISPLGHKYEPTVTAPTCTEGGYTTYTCSACNGSYIADQVDAKGHTEKTLAAVAPTCTATGLTEGKQCTVCNTVTVIQQTVDSLGHTEKTLAAVAPTCTETGLTEGKQCTVCNEVLVAQTTVNALGHTNSAEVKENTVDSTCSAEGSYDSVIYCSVCSTEISRTNKTIAKKAHTEVVDAAIAPTCTVAGLSEGKHCSVCNEVLVAQTTVNALGHTETVVPGKAATCTATGLTDGKKCSVCNAEILAQEVIPVIAHDERILEAEAATCIKEGKTEGKYCFSCGTTLVAQTAVPKVSHTYDNASDLVCNVCNAVRDCLHAETIVVSGNAATCTESGLTDGVACKICGDTLTAQEVIPATGHLNQVDIPAVDPTCTEAGSTAGKKCNTCGKVLVEPTEIPKKGHTETILAAKAATCIETGLTEGKKCTVCSKILVEQEIIPVTNHTYSGEWSKDGAQHWHACNVCGAKADTANHDYTTEVAGSRVNAFCEKEGKYTLACECGATKDVIIPALEHTYSGEWTETETQHWHECSRCGGKKDVADHNYTTEVAGSRVDATCTANGSYTLACVCGATKNETIISEGHSYESVVTPPTCTEQGYTTHTCSKCGDTKKDSFVQNPGHSYNAVVVEPTCTEDGYTTYTCSVCDASYVADRIQATGHSYSENWINDENQHWHECSCGAKTDISEHIFDNACDADCNDCGITRVPSDHVYDDDSDTTCNNCGEIRVIIEPSVITEEITKEYDIFNLENKDNIIIDLSENVDNAGNLSLSYFVNGASVDSLYTFNFGSYSETVTYESFTVTVSYKLNGETKSIQYIYKLELKDTTKYRLVNGGFENGLEGWTQVGEIGGVSSDTHYWLNDPERAEGYEFGMDGNNMFSAYAPGAYENAVGTLTSSTFTVGGSGYVTFKLGAAKDANYVYVEVCDFVTGRILARYSNANWADRTEGAKSGCTLNAYRADLSAFMGKKVSFRIVDTAYSDYGLFFADSFETYYESIPEGFSDAVECDRYQIANGSFESGNLSGWTMDIHNAGAFGTLGWVQNSERAEGWYTTNDNRKDGNYLFTFYSLNGENCENTTGYLTSSTFTLKKNSYISFKFGAAGSASVSIRLVKTDGTVIASFYNDSPYRVNTELHSYYYQYTGEEADCYILIIDNAESNYGCFVVDDFRVNLETKPNGYRNAAYGANNNYDIANGSFEDGLDGWTMNIAEAGAHNTLGWVLRTEIDAGWYTKNDDIKDGNNLFTFAQPGDINCENTKGTLQSSTFTLKQNGFVSFKFGGAGGGSNHDVWVELCKEDGTVIARFYNDAPGKVNTRMNSYFYQYTGEETNCFFRVVDNSTGDYGCFVVDDFRVNLEAAPDGYIAAIQ